MSSVSHIDFEQLTLQDALDLAVLIEEEACERYQEFRRQLMAHDTLGAAGFFLFMANNEARHGDELRARRAELFGDAPRRVTRAMLWDVEAPAYDEVRAFMSATEALEVALRAEQKAYAFFDAACRTVHGRVRALFQQLRDEEQHHIELVRHELASQLPEVDGSPYADDPVGH
jgi:rubrerythrin